MAGWADIAGESIAKKHCSKWNEPDVPMEGGRPRPSLLLHVCLWLNFLVKLTIAWIGKTKEPAIQALTDEYLKRLGRYANVEGVALKDETALLKFCGRGARPHMLVLLDGKGKQLSSEELAGWLHD